MSTTSKWLFVILALVILEIAGYFVWKNFKPATSPSTPTPIITPSVDSQTASDLKTYTNTDYGFSFAYPKSWISTDFFTDAKYPAKSLIVLADQNLAKGVQQAKQNNEMLVDSVPTFGVQVFDDYQTLINVFSRSNDSSKQLDIIKSQPTTGDLNTFTNFLKTEGNAKWNGSDGVNISPLKIGDIDAIQVDFYENGGSLYTGDKYYFVNNNKFFVITTDSTIEKNSINKILSTFKFTDSSTVSTADWKTYTSKDYRFSVEYPTDYTESELNGRVGSVSDQSGPGGVIYNVIFAAKNGSEFSVQVADKSFTVEPNGMDPVKTTDTTIAGKNGKNFDDIAYVVDGATYRFRIVYSGDASITPTQQQKDILKRMVSTFQFTK